MNTIEMSSAPGAYKHTAKWEQKSASRKQDGKIPFSFILMKRLMNLQLHGLISLASVTWPIKMRLSIVLLI